MEGRVANLEEEMTGIKTEIKELKEMFGEMMRLWKGKNSTQDGEKLVAADPRETNTSAAHGREEAEAQQKNGEGRNHVGGRPRGGRPPARTPEEVGKCVAVSIVQDTTREKWLEMLRNDPEVQQKVAHLLDQVDGSSAAPESTRPQWEVRDKLVYRGGKLMVTLMLVLRREFHLIVHPVLNRLSLTRENHTIERVRVAMIWRRAESSSGKLYTASECRT
ncbi:hypothetical protein GUJ93_ZPchr0010g11243 [Zizania palustris]|uniref:Uncharacterized protein n=1 Tax=Zizania palustris TaxID=103762 RepID=A0A8J5WFM7_ZIZPA|nr:hypothetical protein GUJ93_ZPchr0010g11243 [Zizania palustris]